MDVWLGNLQQNQFSGIKNVNISYGFMQQEQPSPAVILVNGRIESYLKYHEVANEFYSLGYSVYMLDHRGQGLSQRMLSNPHKGHVEEFDHYVADLATFIETIVQPNKHLQQILLGHSMGGAICTRYLQTRPHSIDKVILASPMHGICLPAPQWLILCVTQTLEGLSRLFNAESKYVLGGSGYDDAPFAENELTQSQARYSQFRQLYQQQPSIQLGSPTNAWLIQAIKASGQCVRQASMIEIPTLLLQAGAETIVDNQAQDYFAKNMLTKWLKKTVIENARHEVLFEIEEYREQAWQAIREFIAKEDRQAQ
ncbi:alpha/beta fold hydrolase [Psychrobium sp. 1_MG-2023]|uniref:alpha/beta fold hydrolase n=1 Tax=Psychrobium sp. 1_MG-2023 TaxID=3062624 RepID=UPI00267CC8D3|nr:alpha/beta fold hydrolase [Psychrobium sp. 1_MG-2023]MDP2561089.1 alpha/beta fold hydrolase [Psychrobium sp. 1_MG-2023]